MTGVRSGKRPATTTAAPVAQKRLAHWEVRNLEMVTHIRKMTLHHPGGRVVVVVGGGHEAFFDACLDPMLDVEVVQLDEVLDEADRSERRSRHRIDARIEPETGRVDAGVGTYRLLAHEAAHPRWTDAADSQGEHDFLNESFAEYGAWLSLRERAGEQADLDVARTLPRGSTGRLDATVRVLSGTRDAEAAAWMEEEPCAGPSRGER